MLLKMYILSFLLLQPFSEDKPWPRGQKIMSLASALRAVAVDLALRAVASVLSLRVLNIGLGLNLEGPGLEYNFIFWDVSCQCESPTFQNFVEARSVL